MSADSTTDSREPRCPEHGAPVVNAEVWECACKRPPTTEPATPDWLAAIEARLERRQKLGIEDPALLHDIERLLAEVARLTEIVGGCETCAGRGYFETVEQGTDYVQEPCPRCTLEGWQKHLLFERDLRKNLRAEVTRQRAALEMTVAACGCGGTGTLSIYDLSSGEVLNTERCQWCATLRKALEGGA